MSKYSVVPLVVCMLVLPCHADEGPVDVHGYNGATLQFRNWDETHAGWSDIEYKGSSATFKLYDLPSNMPPSGISTVAADTGKLSPDKKYVMMLRVDSGEVVDEQGNKINSEQTHCDAVSLENGCVTDVGSAFQCDGTWQGQKWKVATGGILDPSQKDAPPNQLIKNISRLPAGDSRSSSLKNWMFMGVPSYMACYPPEKNISEFNDIGFYFAEGGEHLLAMQIYNKLLNLAPDRVPLKLNVADSLWALGKHDEAKSFYSAYRDEMLKKGAGGKVPTRIQERLN